MMVHVSATQSSSAEASTPAISLHPMVLLGTRLANLRVAAN